MVEYIYNPSYEAVVRKIMIWCHPWVKTWDCIIND
jgi:hypothetical protein